MPKEERTGEAPDRPSGGDVGLQDPKQPVGPVGEWEDRQLSLSALLNGFWAFSALYAYLQECNVPHKGVSVN
jgi:hypothetical protein